MASFWEMRHKVFDDKPGENYVRDFGDMMRCIAHSKILSLSKLHFAGGISQNA